MSGHEMSTLTKRDIKFTKKMMRMARAVADDNDACYSRHIGCVITDREYRVVGMGYNGPPKGTPHTDTFDYLRNFFIPQLNEIELAELDISNKDTSASRWCDTKTGCKTCPRRFVNAGPGQRSTLCSCQHAERNAITNARGSLDDAIIFCWCGVPCIDCTGAIINSGIKTVHSLRAEDYHPEARFLMDRAQIKLYEWTKETFDD